MRREHVVQLVTEAEALICGSEKVELERTRCFSKEFAHFWPQIFDDQTIERINGAAIRIYLWLLPNQEEPARRQSMGPGTDGQLKPHLVKNSREWYDGLIRTTSATNECNCVEDVLYHVFDP